jgi:hypothetical protein
MTRSHSPISRAFVIVALVSLAASCRAAERQQLGTWKAERDTVGDTIIVRTVSGSVWGAPATLREDLAIGVLEGREELMFGMIQEMAVDASGGIYVFDGRVPALRYFDSTGTYVRTLGGKGAGPGEYQDAALGIGIRRDGRIVLRDPRNARLNIYKPDGTPDTHWAVASGLHMANATVLDTADHAYLRILLSPPERNKPWRIGLLHLDDQGRIVDSIGDPEIAGAPADAGGTFLPSKIWAWSPLGYMVVGVNNVYRFELRPANQPVFRIERTTPVVHVLPEERVELEARNEWYRKNQGRFMTADLPPIPSTKPPYREFLIAQDGRIWVRLHATAIQVEREDAPADRPPVPSWVAPPVFDVFEPDGTYLGEVRVPTGTTVMVARGETAWGTRQGESGEIYVVRLRLQHSANHEEP